MEKVKVNIRRKEGCKDLPLPRYMSEGASGVDLYAAVETELVLEPQQIRAIPSGVFVEVPTGYEAQVRARSGLALKNGLAVVNAPGTIDSDYRGEICVILCNLGKEPFNIQRGMRIAQLVFQPVVRAELEETEELQKTKRNEGGFGHTGV
ncbi:MAG TPA: dUTP diphosphatase [Candidatus Tripitaka californicus]|uniref:dUTP diphosphatase n=1 Tax=Candidatus Tripitaka californicus TaxID=3367616 RepID=UPI004024BBB6|nr:dUTP diphosphatase [Planctomycetota bacterium]